MSYNVEIIVGGDGVSFAIVRGGRGRVKVVREGGSVHVSSLPSVRRYVEYIVRPG